MPGGAMVFKHEDLLKATNGFSKASIIGKGGFGSVFKGTLRHVVVACKVLNDVSYLLDNVYTVMATQRDVTCDVIQTGVQAMLRAGAHSQLETEVAALTRLVSMCECKYTHTLI
jgi:hypothetical protein